MSYKITKDDEAYWLQIDGKKSALIRLEDHLRFGIVLDAVREAYEEQETTKPSAPQADDRKTPSPEAMKIVSAIRRIDSYGDSSVIECLTYSEAAQLVEDYAVSQRAELIAIAATSRGVTPEQIVVEE